MTSVRRRKNMSPGSSKAPIGASARESSCDLAQNVAHIQCSM
jgi:hypothetical protein